MTVSKKAPLAGFHFENGRRWCPDCATWVSPQVLDAAGHHDKQVFRGDQLVWVRCPRPTLETEPSA